MQTASVIRLFIPVDSGFKIVQPHGARFTLQ
jgi:hypothetical protein